MGEPTFIDTPKGDQLVLMTRADYEALVADATPGDADDAADVAAGEAALAAWEGAGKPAYPLAVLRLMRSGDSALRAFRRHAKLTQEDVASRAGLSQGHLSDLEQGRRAPSPEALAKLAAILGTNAASLAASPFSQI